MMTPEERARIGPEDARKAIAYLKQHSAIAHWPRLDECAEILDEITSRWLRHESVAVERPAEIIHTHVMPRIECEHLWNTRSVGRFNEQIEIYCSRCGMSGGVR